jgi:hypothetical protein
VQQAMAGRNPDIRCWTPHRAAHRHQSRRRDCEGDYLYGDGVNIAARIEALADAGAVFISYTVYYCHLQGSLSLAPLIAGGTQYGAIGRR